MAISGCIQLGEEEAPAKYGNGLVITSFEAFPSTLFSGEEYSVSVEVQNKGGRTANKIGFYLFNVKGADEAFKSEESLEPPTENLAGDVTSKIWDALDAPTLEKGITDTINPKIRVYYKYTTLASTKIPVLSRTEWKRKLRKGEEMPSLESTTVTPGPFSVKINTRSPVTVKSGEPETFRVSITGENMLSGTAYRTSAHPYGDDWGDEIPIQSNDINKLNISVATDSPIVAGESNCLGNPVERRLQRGETFRYDCEVEVKEGMVKTSAEIPITVTLSYGYFIDESTSLTVKGE